MAVSMDQVLREITAANQRTKQELTEQINNLTAALSRLETPRVEPYQPIAINPAIDSGNFSLDLIKSLPEFNGESSSYPAWRSAANFALNYYPEGSEKYYVAMGIFRNKITGSANLTLSSFNTVLNFKAIIARLDQTYADKRPIHVLENELSILRQGNLSILDYYNVVDKHLTLIINKQIMSHSGNAEVVTALNERARENALRVFISGLRRPICDILFSSGPKDLPTALAVAQELETNHKRHDFAQTFAMGNLVRPNKPKAITSQYTFSKPNPRPTPMDVDTGSSTYQNHTAHTSSFKRNNDQLPFGTVPQQQYSQPHQGTAFKRSRDQSGSFQRPFSKAQRVNYMPEEVNSVLDESDNICAFNSQSDNQINFLN